MIYFVVIDKIRNQCLRCDNAIQLGFVLESVMDSYLIKGIKLKVYSYNNNKIYVIKERN